VGRSWIVALIVVAACGARLGSTESSSRIDAPDPFNHGGDDASALPPDAPAVAMSDAPACFNGRVVFLSFEGVTLTQAMTDDATQNQASWIGVATANVPAYHAGNMNRATQIMNITSAVQSILGGFPVTVVTTRPLSGPFVMVAFGGTNMTVGSQYTYATSFHDCGDLVKSDVAWVSDTVPTSKAADYAVGAIAWALGLQGTNDPTDCMCEWANSCVQSSTHCSLHGPISTTTSSSPATTCPGLTTQDENATFSQAFCH
jgi:hypothetical protein